MNDSTTQAIIDFMRLNFSLNEGEFDMNTSFKEGGLIDSLGMLEVILFLEERFGIMVEDEAAASRDFDSVAMIAAYVESRRTRLTSGA